LVKKKKKSKKEKAEKSPRFSRKKKKKKVPIFGVDLAELVLKEKRNTYLPVIIEKTVAYLDDSGLDVEGIFRISPRITDINALVKQINDQGMEEIDLFQQRNPHLVAGLMKKWFRELPDPILTFELYTCFIAIWSITDPTVRLAKTREILKMLPEPNGALVQFMLDFLARVARHSKENKMTVSNIATIFGPIFMRCDLDIEEFISESSIVCDIIRELIEQRAFLFGDEYVDPSFTVTNNL